MEQLFKFKGFKLYLLFFQLKFQSSFKRPLTDSQRIVRRAADNQRCFIFITKNMPNSEKFYAVARGKQVGIYRTWEECKAQVANFQNARYKRFATESEARQFIAEHIAVPQANSSSSSSHLRAPTPSHRKRKFEPNEEEPSERVKQMKSNPEDLKEFENAPKVYTDGACSLNGQRNAKAGWGVYWGDGHEDNDCGPVYGAPTNNRGELIAVEKAIEKAIEKNYSQLVVYTDSKLLIDSLTMWITGWKKRGWKTSTGSDVLNQDVLKKVDELRNKLKVKFVHVRGHQGIHGNEMADELARRGAQMFRN